MNSPPAGGRTSFRRAHSPRCWRGRLRRYQNWATESAQVIEEFIGLAREMNSVGGRGEELGLTDDELAFYDTLLNSLPNMNLLISRPCRVIGT